MYVSVTGLQLRSIMQRPRFAWHAMRAFAQASKAPGNLFTDARMLGGVHHTLTVWNDRQSMLAYLRKGAHREAMKAYPALGMGRTCGYRAECMPDWSEALEVWRRDATAA
ncbi:MAG: hypothetical protein AAF739_16480 [Pseudomonadota bacterium]